MQGLALAACEAAHKPRSGCDVLRQLRGHRRPAVEPQVGGWMNFQFSGKTMLVAKEETFGLFLGHLLRK